MGLKSFHIFFILVSTLFFGFFAIWLFREYSLRGGVENAVGGATCAILGALMVRYSGWFMRKFKDVGYM